MPIAAELDRYTYSNILLLTQMNGNQYVRQVLSKYRVPRGRGSATEDVATSVAPLIEKWGGKCLNSITYSGSYAKGTAVSTGTDVDLFISIDSDIPKNLSHIYNSLYRLVSNRGWSARRQNVSVGIAASGVEIDLVPGRVQPGYQNYHSLYRSKTDSWTQTNVKLHIDKISSSGRRSEIKAIKIWRDLRNLEFPSVFIELIVLEALKNLSSSDSKLARNVLKCLEHIRDSIKSTRIVDPANSNNVISDEISSFQKSKLSRRASESLDEKYWDNIIW